ncbi:MAG: ABC transporter permease subunit [Nitrospinaceae bacterium]
MPLKKDTIVKLKRFRNDRRAYFSFIVLLALFLVTLPAEWICNVRPILLVVDGKPYFPILFTYSEKDFGGSLPSEPDYKSESFLRLLKGEVAGRPGKELLGDFDENSPEFSLGLGDFEEDTETPSPPNGMKEKEHSFPLGLEDFEEEESGSLESGTDQAVPLVSPASGGAGTVRAGPRDFWMIWPPIRYDYKYIPSRSETGTIVLAAPYRTPARGGEGYAESSMVDGHYLGTDDRGRDVLARLVYGFRISMIFGLSLAITGTILGCFIGGLQGFFGGWVDLMGQRLTEIWGSIPRLYILIILSSFLVPSALILFVILNLTAWMGIAAYIRAEFLKIRNFEFVKAAKAMGVTNFGIMRRHILPNALTPVVTFFPFEVTAGILALVSLDYLNLGVPSPAPSMGELLAQGKNNLQAIWILLPTFTLLTVALTLLTFVGEGIRNAFDPRKAV